MRPLVILSLFMSAFATDINVHSGGYVVVFTDNRGEPESFQSFRGISYNNDAGLRRDVETIPERVSGVVEADCKFGGCFVGNVKYNHDLNTANRNGKSFRRAGAAEIREMSKNYEERNGEETKIQNTEQFNELLKSVISDGNKNVSAKADLMKFIFNNLRGPAALGGTEFMVFIPMQSQETSTFTAHIGSRKRRSIQGFTNNNLESFLDSIDAYIKNLPIPDCDIKSFSMSRTNCFEYLSFNFEQDRGFCKIYILCEEGKAIKPGSSDCVIMEGVKVPCGTGQVYKSKLSNTKSVSRLFSTSDFNIPVEVCKINGEVVRSDCKSLFEVKKELFFGIRKGALEKSWNSDGMIEMIDSGNIASYNCSGCEDDCSKCKTGDEQYKSHFMAALNECSCAIDQSALNYGLKIEGEMRMYDAIISDQFLIEYEGGLINEDKCEGCKVKCLGHGLDFEKFKKLRKVVVCVKGQCKTHDPVKFIRLSSGDLISKSEVTVSLYYGRSGLQKKTLVCDLDDFCGHIGCHFCLERILNPECYTNVEIAVFVTIGVSSYIVLSLMFFACKILSLIRLAFFPILRLLSLSSVLIKKIVNSIAGRVRTIKKSNDKTAKKVDKKDVEMGYKSRSMRPNTDFRMQTSLMVFCLFTVCLGCSDVVKLESNQLDCVVNNDHKLCSTIESVQVGLGPIGQVVCLYVENDERAVVGHIELAVLSSDLICERSELYHTYTPTVRTSKIYRCHWVGNCEQEYCTTKGDQLDPSIQSELLNYVGITGCSLVDGGWGNVCFSFSSACVFYRSVFRVTDGVYYKIENCPSYRWSMKLRVTSSLEGVSRTEDITLQPSQRKSAIFGSLSLNSVSTPQNNILNKCFMTANDGSTSLVECSGKSELVKGKVGELRCDNEEQAKKGGNACIFSKDIVSVSTIESDISVSLDVLNLAKIHQSSLLPLSSGGLSIHRVNEDFHVSLDRNTAFSVQLDIKKLKVRAYHNLAKCDVSFQSLTGCYLCDNNALLKLMISSTQKTTVRLTCKASDIVVPVVISGTQGEEMSLRLPFNRPIIDEQCELSCDNKPTFNIKGTLLFVKTGPLTIRSDGDSISIFTPVSVFGNWMWSLNSLEKIFSISIFVGLVIILIIVLTVLCKMIPSKLKRKRY